MAGGRSLSMATLINDGILTPGEKLLTFDYMGMHYEADLRPDGLIAWNEGTYSSPYSWASQCKNLVNPDQKSGIGWGHIRYRGIKLSQYKTVYLRKHKLAASSEQEHSVEPVGDTHQATDGSGQMPGKRGRKRKHLVSKDLEETPCNSQEEAQSIADLPSNHHGNSMAIQDTPAGTQGSSNFLECTAFASVGLEQPFTVTLSSNVLLVMDFQSHLCTSEVAGYLGGHYDSDTKSMEVVQAFPCRCELTNGEQGMLTEKEIQSTMAAKGLQVVGWYHSHPVSEPRPSQNDVLVQKRYQEAVRCKRQDEPCVAFIIGPNLGAKLQDSKTVFGAFWVLTVGQDGIKASPMEIKYSVTWEQYLTQDVVDEMNALAAHYKSRADYPNFRAVWKNDVLLLQKLKASLSAVQPKFPQENSDETFMSYIEQLVLQ